MNCTFCGSPVSEGALFCKNCGVTLSNNNAASTAATATEINKTAANEPQPIDAYAQVNPNSPYAPQPAAPQQTAAQTSAYSQNNAYAQNSYAPNNGYAQTGTYDPNAAYNQMAGQTNAYGQTGAYGQNSVYVQNSAYAQNSAYSQNSMYSQNGMYGQTGTYGSNGGYTYNAPVTTPADNSTPTLVLGIISLALSFTVYFSLGTLIMGPISISKAVGYKKRNGSMDAKSKVGLGLSIGGLSVCVIYILIFIIAFVAAIVEEL